LSNSAIPNSFFDKIYQIDTGAAIVWFVRWLLVQIYGLIRDNSNIKPTQKCSSDSKTTISQLVGKMPCQDAMITAWKLERRIFKFKQPLVIKGIRRPERVLCPSCQIYAVRRSGKCTKCGQKAQGEACLDSGQ
jgi:hypothetical protein